MIALAESPTSRVDLIARGSDGNRMRGWYYIDGYFQSDRDDEFVPADRVFELASPTNELMLMLVSRGSARRIATDRDNDLTLDLTETEFGFDPLNAQSRATNLPLTIHPGIAPGSPYARLEAGQAYSNAFDIYGIEYYGTSNEDTASPSADVAFSFGDTPPPGVMIDPANGIITWTPSDDQKGKKYRIPIRVSYVAPPALSTTVVLRWRVNGPVILDPPRVDSTLHRTIIKVRVSDDRILRVQYADDLGVPSPTWLELGPVDEEIVDLTWPLRPRRFYRASFAD